MDDILQRILHLIRGSQSVLVTSHRDPDGDSIGSQLALAELLESRGKSYRIINQGVLPYKYLFLDPDGKIKSAHRAKGQKDAAVVPDLIFVLDCTCLSRMGEVERLITSGATLVNIDHHPDNESYGTLNYLDTEASAVGEMIFLLLQASGHSISSFCANQLFAAILTDTGRFKFSNTSPRCLKVCAELLESGADPKYVTNQIYFNHSLPFLKLLGSILSNPQIIGDGRICSMTIPQKLLADLKIDPKEVEGVVDYSLFLKGVEIGLLFSEKGTHKTKVNLRSQNEFDVSKIARAFGGGGHRNAAGCSISHNLEETKRIILELIRKTLKDESIRSISS